MTAINLDSGYKVVRRIILVTTLDCNLITPECIDHLHSATVYSFKTTGDRDTYFATHPELLINQSGKNTLAFVGDSTLEYYYWDGPHEQTPPINTNWKIIKTTTDHVAATDTLYWGDPNVDLSMRARRDTGNGYLVFERRIGGTWVEKFKVSDSASVDSMKFIESKVMPTVQTNELGLYAALVKDSDHGDAWVLRPIFMDSAHNHFMTVAAAPDGSLRVPQNVDAALMDPDNVPVTYKKVILADEGTVIRDALIALPDGQKLPSTAISGSNGTMTGAEIIKAIVDDITEPKLPADDIANLTGTEYLESDSALNFDPVDKTYIEVAYEHTGSVTQTMPNLVNCRDGLRLMMRNIKLDESTITLVPANSGQTIDGSNTYTINKGVSVLFIAMTGRASWHVETVFEHDTPTTSGIEIDDGTSDAAGVSKVNLKGMKITELPNQGTMGSGEVEVTSGINIHMATPNEQYGSGLATEMVLMPPLKTFVDPNTTGGESVVIELAHDAFEPMHKPSFLAYLSEDIQVIGKVSADGSLSPNSHHDGALWFDDIVWPSGAYIQTDRANKKYGIQEADNLDPNVTGGTDYLLGFRVHMKGTAPSDGFVRIYLFNASVDPYEPTGILEDVNGNLMAVQRNYKAGEELGVLDLLSVVNAKGLQEFTCHVVDSLVNDILELTDRTEGATGLLIQAITSESKTGMGLQQFELDTNQNIEFSSHYLGADRMNMAYINSRDGDNVVAYTANSNFISVDGWRLINPDGIKVGVVNGHTHIQDDGVHLADFNFGRVFSAEETRLLRGKDIDVTATLVDKQNGFEVALMKWTGTPDAYTPEIFTTRTNSYPVMQPNWIKADSLFISEDAVSGDHTKSKTFTIPQDANNYAIIIYPTTKQIPLTLQLKELKVDVNPAFTGYIINAPELLNEMHLHNSTEYAKVVADNLYYASFRYTLINVPSGMPMPVGKIVKGKADVEIDQTINQVTGSSDHAYEGAIKFNVDGRATLSTKLLIWSEQPTNTLSTTKFWWSRVSPNGQVFTKITDSELTVDIRGGTKAINAMPTFSIDVEDGERIALFGTTGVAYGAFIKSISHDAPMVSTEITFKELLAGGSDDPSTAIDSIDLSSFSTEYYKYREVKASFTDTNQVSIPVVIPTGIDAYVVAIFVQSGDKIIQIDPYETEYSNNTLIVHLTKKYSGAVIVRFIE